MGKERKEKKKEYEYMFYERLFTLKTWSEFYFMKYALFLFILSQTFAPLAFQDGGRRGQHKPGQRVYSAINSVRL
jgi:hypothetical protein